jgi:hypothetical protein
MYPNVFGVIKSLQHATSSARCLPLSLMVPLLAPFYFLPPQSSLYLLEFLGVFVTFTTLDPVWTNLILVPLGVSFLVILGLIRDIGATLQSCSTTLQVLVLLLLILSHISLELVLQRIISSSCLLHRLSLFRLRIPYLPPLFLYLPPCLCL